MESITLFTFSIPSSKASNPFDKFDVTAADLELDATGEEESDLPGELKLQANLFVGKFNPRELDLTSLLSIGTKSRQPWKIIPEGDGGAVTALLAFMVLQGEVVVMAAKRERQSRCWVKPGEGREEEEEEDS